MNINIGYNISAFGRTERINPISRDVRVKRENYEAVHEREINKRYSHNHYIEELANKKMKFLSPTEVYLNCINENKELLFSLTINTHPAYDLDDGTLGKNIDVTI